MSTILLPCYVVLCREILIRMWQSIHPHCVPLSTPTKTREPWPNNIIPLGCYDVFVLPNGIIILNPLFLIPNNCPSTATSQPSECWQPIPITRPWLQHCRGFSSSSRSTSTIHESPRKGDQTHTHLHKPSSPRLYLVWSPASQWFFSLHTSHFPTVVYTSLGDDDVDVDGAEERNTAQKHANIPDRIINLIYSQSQDSCARDRIESSTYH